MATVITDSISIAAGARNDDVLAAKRNAIIHVTARRGARIALYTTGSAAGLFHEMYVGERNAMERSLVNAQNRVPVVPDDFVVGNIAGLPNERVRLSVDNPTGGAITLFYRLEIAEL